MEEADKEIVFGRFSLLRNAFGFDVVSFFSIVLRIFQTRGGIGFLCRFIIYWSLCRCMSVPPATANFYSPNSSSRDSEFF